MRLSSWVQEFNRLLRNELTAAYPNATRPAIEAVSFGVLGIYFNVDALAPLQLPKRFGAAARRAVEQLIGTLED